MAVPGSVPTVRYDLARWSPVSAVVSTTEMQCDALNPFPDGYFKDWGLYILRDTRSTALVAAEPQGQMRTVSSFTKETRRLTHPVFTRAVLAGAEILLLHPSVASIFSNSDSILDQVAKLAGNVPVANSVAANWQAAEQTLVSIGTEGDRYKVQDLTIGLQNLIGNITIRMYKLVNGVERRVYPPRAGTTWNVPAGDSPSVNIIPGTYSIHGVLRITVQSDNAADNAVAVEYDYMLENMYAYVAPTQRYESNLVWNTNNNFGAAQWISQEFTPSVTHKLQMVRLNVRRMAAGAGNLIAGIRAIDTTTGLPTGAVLSGGYIPAANVNAAAYTVTDVSMSDLVVVAGTRYMMYFAAPTMLINGMDYLYQTPSSYAGGVYLQSADSGLNWTRNPLIDMYFEELGVPV